LTGQDQVLWASAPARLDSPAPEFDTYGTVSGRKTQAALTAKQFHAVAKALADPRRMALLESIGSEREYSCQKLCSEAGVTKGTVSHHVRELLRAGLIDERRDGQYMFYEVRREVLAAYVAELMSRVARSGGS
jgi:ArsR family transcriptional regulator, arsenate/arsenite/antimonite-responsive transcriptional repressor